MKSTGRRYRRIEEAFEEVHRNRAEFHISPDWEEEAMRAIRRLGRQPSRDSLGREWVGLLVWRWTAASALVALTLMLYVMLIDLSPLSEVTGLFFSDPLGMDMVRSFGII
jgi:hypothetical protein